jgi:hypothetical protein
MAKLREAQTPIVRGAVPNGSIIKDTLVVAEVTFPTGPPIHIIPATPQDSQEVAQHVTTAAPPLPPLLIAMTSADANADQGLAAVTRPSTSPHPTPPPPQLCRSPQLLSAGLPPIHSRSTTPLANLKKQLGTSEDREEAKQGRKE